MVPNHPHEKILIHLGRNSMGCCVWLLSCVQFFCNSMDCSLPGSSVHGIFQARILEWVAIALSRKSSRPWDRTCVSCLAGRFFTTEPPAKTEQSTVLWEPKGYNDWLPRRGKTGGFRNIRMGSWRITAAAAKSLQSCPTLCDPIDGSPPGSPVPGILQARTLEWVAISFSNAWKWKMKVKSLSCVWLLATPWTAAHQAPPSVGFSRQESWSGVPWPSALLFLVRGHSYAQAQEGERWVQKAGHSVRHLEATDVCC